jgi:predicted regulator of Ras-like GTPase activity (Roadblock/LC7/MglB family)
MPGLPTLIDEDMQLLDGALDELLQRSEAGTALIIDKGGPLISQRGVTGNSDITTIAALAAGSFCATQAIAERIGETNFSSIYQQGDHHSLLLCNIDDNLLLIVIFKAAISVGAVKYYAATTIDQVGLQVRKARQRAPQESTDLVSMNLVDAANVFRKKSKA